MPNGWRWGCSLGRSEFVLWSGWGNLAEMVILKERGLFERLGMNNLLVKQKWEARYLIHCTFTHWEIPDIVQ